MLVAARQDSRTHNGSQNRADENRNLCVLGVRRAVREGQLSHQQGHGETNTTGCSQTNHVNPGDIRVEVSVLEAGDEPGSTENTEGLTGNQRNHNANRHGVGEGASEAFKTAHSHTRAKEREDRHADAGREGAEAVLQRLCKAVFSLRRLRASGHLHGHQEAQNHTRNGRVNTGLKEESPGDNAQGQKQQPGSQRLQVQHGLTAVGDEREKGERNQREEQVLAVEVIGVEDRDNADCDQVVDHSQGQQEDTHRRGEESAHSGENRHRKRNIGCGGDSPTVQSGGAGEVQRRVDNCGHRNAAEGSRNRHNSGGRRLEVTDHEFFLQLQTGEEEENDEQTVCRPGTDAHL